MRFPAAYSFTTNILPLEENPLTVRGIYQDAWQFIIESVERESGEDITNKLTEDQIIDLELEGSQRYGEYMTCRAEEMAERRRDR